MMYVEDRDGIALSFTRILGYQLPPTLQDYVKVEPGNGNVHAINLNREFDFPAPGSYTVFVSQDYEDPVAGAVYRRGLVSTRLSYHGLCR